MQATSLAGLLVQTQSNGLQKLADGSPSSSAPSQSFGSLLNSRPSAETDAAASKSTQSYVGVFLAKLSKLSEALEKHAVGDLSDGAAAAVIDDLEVALVEFDNVTGSQLSEVFAEDLAKSATQISIAAKTKIEPAWSGYMPDGLSGLADLVIRTIQTLKSLGDHVAGSRSDSFAGRLPDVQTALVLMGGQSEPAEISTLGRGTDFARGTSVSDSTIISALAALQRTDSSEETWLERTIQGVPLRSPPARDPEIRDNRGLMPASGAIPRVNLAQITEITTDEQFANTSNKSQRQFLTESVYLRGGLDSSNSVVSVASAGKETRSKAKAIADTHDGKHGSHGAGTSLKLDTTTSSSVHSFGLSGHSFAEDQDIAPSSWRIPTFGISALPTNSIGEALFSPDLAQTYSANERVSGSGRDYKDTSSAPSKFTQAIVSQLRFSEIGEGTTRVELSPRGLGSVEIEVSTDIEGVVSVVIRAESNSVLAALRDAREHLMQMLSSGQGGDLSFENKSSGNAPDKAPDRADSSERELEHSNGAVSVALGSQKAQIISGGSLDIVT